MRMGNYAFGMDRLGSPSRGATPAALEDNITVDHCEIDQKRVPINVPRNSPTATLSLDAVLSNLNDSNVTVDVQWELTVAGQAHVLDEQTGVTIPAGQTQAIYGEFNVHDVPGLLGALGDYGPPELVYELTGGGGGGGEPPPEPMVIEDWERANPLAAWSGDTGLVSIQSGISCEGSNAAVIEAGDQSIFPELLSFPGDGLPYYPQVGDTFEFYVRSSVVSGAENVMQRHAFGVEDANNYYQVQLNWHERDNWFLQDIVDGQIVNEARETELDLSVASMVDPLGVDPTPMTTTVIEDFERPDPLADYPHVNGNRGDFSLTTDSAAVYEGSAAMVGETVETTILYSMDGLPYHPVRGDTIRVVMAPQTDPAAVCGFQFLKDEVHSQSGYTCSVEYELGTTGVDVKIDRLGDANVLALNNIPGWVAQDYHIIEVDTSAPPDLAVTVFDANMNEIASDVASDDVYNGRGWGWTVGSADGSAVVANYDYAHVVGTALGQDFRPDTCYRVEVAWGDPLVATLFNAQGEAASQLSLPANPSHDAARGVRLKTDQRRASQVVYDGWRRLS